MMEEHQPLISQEILSKNSEDNVMLRNDKVEDEDIMQHSSGENLNLHLGLHSTELSYNEEPFPEQSHVVITGTAQKGGKRLQCGKQFTKSLDLSTQRTHTEEKLYSCSECGNTFIQKSDLVNHERIHTGEKPYSCSECEKCFTQKSDLVKHQRFHTGENPYSCSECGKRFTHKSALYIHQRFHTGDKPFICLECGKCFTRSTNLIAHERIHTGEKPYSCSECEKCFTNLSFDLILIRYLPNVSPDEPNDSTGEMRRDDDVINQHGVFLV
ncbi:zinc finger protein 2 homolog [Bufo bufo]|uniref:zinc finger protein 2 homolog n=1 Tax=Bufo bufo TaxID=8384 RepID=UPI001ABE5EB5|nr:zinc finger protein 2 homolog [Bufo bufo]